MLLLAAVLFGLGDVMVWGQNDTTPEALNDSTAKVFVFEIREQIAPPVWRKTQLALEEARNLRADVIIIDMNTYGGMVESADSIRTAILQSNIPVYVFINNNAASAGALISISCNKIFMRPGANIGAATVVNQSGEKMPDKYQSYMRATMRSTAEATGRDPKIAEAMVDERVEIEGITEAGKVLTFTTKEAIKHNYCDGEAESIPEVLELSGIKDYQIIKQTLKGTDKVIGFLISPFISGILIMIIVGGIYFELQSPGVGFPIGAAILAAILYFAPLYLEGLAANWEIVLFVAGIILMAVEVFVLPGFGIAGTLGIIAIIIGLTFAMVENREFKFTFDHADAIARSFFLVIISVLTALLGSFYLSKKLFTTTTFGHLALDEVQDKSDGYTSSDSRYQEKIGLEGVATSILRPAGKIEIDNQLYDAFSETGYIEKGSRVKVTGYTNMQLKVRKLD
jgi:membrane-bound serine protease (ClpP class)